LAKRRQQLANVPMSQIHRSPTDRGRISGCYAALIVLAVATRGVQAESTARGVPNAMQGFSQNRDQPIQIEAASLVMRDKEKQATFSGDVKVVQGDTTMKSKSLVVFYDSAGTIKSATPGPGGSSSIRRLEAKGKVVVTQKNQVVTGESAVFDTKTNLITMQQDVVLTQCTNVMRGDRLVVDMTTGVSRVESNSGHVQGLFAPSGQGCASPIPSPGPAGAPHGSK
jgi:lipopolysaccharide export system protein LptA